MGMPQESDEALNALLCEHVKKRFEEPEPEAAAAAAFQNLLL